MKIKYAEQLLKTTSLSINEISDTLGFSSPYHFSNLFKSYYRLSPKHFRDSIAATQQGMC
ncbi:MAG: helix-turn-helix domain-containing protein [Clostridia bacterium]